MLVARGPGRASVPLLSVVLRRSPRVIARLLPRPAQVLAKALSRPVVLGRGNVHWAVRRIQMRVTLYKLYVPKQPGTYVLALTELMALARSTAGRRLHHRPTTTSVPAMAARAAQPAHAPLRAFKLAV